MARTFCITKKQRTLFQAATANVRLRRRDARSRRVRVRGARKDAMDKLKAALKISTITEDEFRDFEKEVQTLTDKSVKSIDAHFEAKEKDVMTV